jgi:hypothetical protein
MMNNIRPICVMCLILLTVSILLHIPASPAAQEGPLTVAEASGFKVTSRHVDVMQFIAELQRQSPLIRV